MGRLLRRMRDLQYAYRDECLALGPNGSDSVRNTLRGGRHLNRLLRDSSQPLPMCLGSSARLGYELGLQGAQTGRRIILEPTTHSGQELQ
mmetsp:Transcript_13293/g.20961  ORF Transcript_13293/g.20961 Transcript_13293/m.20961 type:complete len:90 (-) Transcript_13293:457-726(-)